MKTISFDRVTLTNGYLFDKQEMNRKITIHAVYDRFDESGRIGAFDFAWKEGDPMQPHIYWDSDVAKWMEGAAYILKQHAAPDLEAKVDALVEKIRANQGEDGYFNIYYSVVEPEGRFTNRDRHELYCAGHLIEAAVAYAEATGKTTFLHCMERYADYIRKVFIEEKSAAFFTPGHQELELALVRLYRHTGKKQYLDMAAYFINTRGVNPSENSRNEYDQSHLPVREQTEALGHAVRAMYLYTGMAYLAAETGEEELIRACKTLWEDATRYKMYVTGGLGSTRIGEAFTTPFDLPNDTAYTETCAAIGLILFSSAMLALESDAKYADVLERALYNGMLSGISLDGRAFFYENPLEITLNEHFENSFGNRKLPITQRVECFRCSCCPPNLNRVFPSLGNYLYGVDGNRLYINQYTASTLSDGALGCTVKTDYPRSGHISVMASGATEVALRIPSWCQSFTLNRPYRMERGYAVVENDGSEIRLVLDMPVRAIWADPRVVRDAGRLCITRGPIVYCAEAVDNGSNLHRFSVPADFTVTESENDFFGLPTLDISCYEKQIFSDGLYASRPPEKKPATLRLIPYNGFANRGESDMLVWLCAE